MRTLPPPQNANAELQAAWQIYPDKKRGCFVFSQAHHRSRLICLAKRSDLYRRQQNEVKVFNAILCKLK